MNQEFQLVYILGAGHSGSTLLNLLLNGHSQILGLNEIQQIGKYMGQKSNDNRLQTDFWQDVKQCYELTTGKPFTSVSQIHWKKASIWQNTDLKQWKNEPNFLTYLAAWKILRHCQAQDFAHWSQCNHSLFSCIVDKSGKKILIDSSKHWQRLYLLQKSGLFNIKVIHLIRDGRAVVNSYIRKFDNFQIGLRRWRNRTMSAFFLRPEFDQADWFQLHYEKLATQPEIVLRDLCAFIGVNYEPQMLNYRRNSCVGMRGNSQVRHRQDETIVLDERWKQELSRLNTSRFTLLGGWLNTYYGY